jgi:hypothetical protein
VNFLDLYGAALDTELGTADRSQAFTTTKRKDAVNAAQLRFVALTDCLKRYATISITDAVGEYDLEAAISDYIRLQGDPSIKIVNGSNTTWIQGHDAFPPRDPEELDAFEPGWRAAPDGRPSFWYLRDNGGQALLGVNPAPDIAAGETWSWLVPYTPRPVNMSADGDQPFTTTGSAPRRLETYHQALAHYAASLLEPLRKNYAAVTRQQNIFSGYVAQYLQNVTLSGRDQIGLMRDYMGEGITSGMRATDPRR